MAVVMTFAIATLLGAMVLGVLYFNWMQLQTGADAAALAWRGRIWFANAAGVEVPMVSGLVRRRRTRHVIKRAATASRNRRSRSE